MAELFRKEKAKMEYQYANIEYVDKMFDKIMKAEKSLKEKEEKFEKMCIRDRGCYLIDFRFRIAFVFQ